MRSLFSTHTSPTAINVGMLLLRVIAGTLILVINGYDKITHYATYVQKFADPFHWGKPVSFGLVIFAEFLCAGFVVLGLFTRLACVPLIITMGVALFSVQQGDVFGPGASAALYLAAFLAIICVGPGRISLDRYIGK